MHNTSNEQHPTWRRSPLSRLLPVAALAAFLVMIAIGEKQIRSSPKWPPPTRHELYGWEIKNPPILDWAIALNLPASLPILMMAELTDSFGYAFYDHHLTVYLPWLILVYCLWRFVAYRLDQISGNPKRETTSRHQLVLWTQAIITLEVFCAAIRITTFPGAMTNAKAAFVCSWAWLLVSILSWVDLARVHRNAHSTHDPGRGGLRDQRQQR